MTKTARIHHVFFTASKRIGMSSSKFVDFLLDALGVDVTLAEHNSKAVFSHEQVINKIWISTTDKYTLFMDFVFCFLSC